MKKFTTGKKIVLIIALWTGLTGAGSLEKSNDVFSGYYLRLKEYVTQNKKKYSLLFEDISLVEKPNRQLLIPFEGKYLYCAHIGWQVAVVLSDTDFTVLDVRSFSAKSGFTMTWYQGLKLILHKNPGTGMAFNRLMEIEIKQNRLKIAEITDPGMIQDINRMMLIKEN